MTHYLDTSLLIAAVEPEPATSSLHTWLQDHATDALGVSDTPSASNRSKRWAGLRSATACKQVSALGLDLAGRCFAGTKSILKLRHAPYSSPESLIAFGAGCRFSTM